MYICEILTSLLFIYRMGRKHRLTNPRKNEEWKKYAARQLLVSIPLSTVSLRALLSMALLQPPIYDNQHCVVDIMETGY